jgi:hypothetical protein
MMEYLGDAAVELAMDYVSRRLQLRPSVDVNTRVAQPGSSHAGGGGGGGGGGRKKGRRNKGVPLDASFLNFHIPKGDVVNS